MSDVSEECLRFDGNRGILQLIDLDLEIMNYIILLLIINVTLGLPETTTIKLTGEENKKIITDSSSSSSCVLGCTRFLEKTTKYSCNDC